MRSLALPSFRPKLFVQELRRRRVFNTVALYVVGAWVALQVTELALPGLGIPDVAIRHVWIGAFLLFPLVLVFGWRYDVSSGGIRRTAPLSAPDADTSLSGLDRGVVGGFSLIVLVVIAITAVRINNVEPGTPLVAVENSIAVLPFRVCADQQRDLVLASGITNEVTNRLSERGRFKVFARVSSSMLAEIGMQVEQIARSLGSEYILGGELCRGEDDELSLVAELSDANGFIVWSERIVQVVNPWDQVTDQLATQVADGTAAHLGDTLALQPDNAHDRIAYEQQLIGWEYLSRDENDKARIAFNKALEREADYAEAKYGLALLELGRSFGLDQGAQIERASPIIEDALELARREVMDNDQDADSHLVIARILRVRAGFDSELLWRKSGEMSAEEVAAGKQTVKAVYAEAERHFRTAITLNPSLTTAYAWLAKSIERQGVERAGEALQVLESAMERDPFNVRVNADIAKRWAARGRFRQAIELLDRFRSLPEVPAEAWWQQLELMTLQDYWDEKAVILVDMLLNDPGAFEFDPNCWQAWWFVQQLEVLGLHEEAEAWFIRLQGLPMNPNLYRDVFDWYVVTTAEAGEIVETKVRDLASLSNEEVLVAYSSSAAHAANALAEQGDYDRAIELMESIQHAPAIWSERAPRHTLGLAQLYLEAGRREDAEPLLERVRLHLEAEYADGIRHPETLFLLADVYGLLGRDEDAIGMFRKSVDYHGHYSCADDLSDYPPWDRLGEDPRVVELCDRMQSDLDRQAERIRKLLARYDPDELLAPLMAMVE